MWCELVVGLVGCAIDGMVMCALNDGMVIYALDDTLLLFFFLEVNFVDMLDTVEVGAVAGDMI